MEHFIEFFTLDQCDIKDYITHFKFTCSLFSVIGFITGSSDSGYRIIVSGKKVDLNEFNIKSIISEDFKEKMGI